MNRRRLELNTLDAVIDEIDRLHACGYERVASWDLARTCDHLTVMMRWSLDGFPREIRFNPVARAVVGPVARFAIVRMGWMPRGIKAPHPALDVTAPRPEQLAVSHCVATLREVRDHDGEFHASPLLGRLTPQQWRRFHLVHAVHHLSLLVPRG